MPARSESEHPDNSLIDCDLHCPLYSEIILPSWPQCLSAYMGYIASNPASIYLTPFTTCLNFDEEYMFIGIILWNALI